MAYRHGNYEHLQNADHRYECDKCDGTFTRYDSLKRHKDRLHTSEEVVYVCSICQATYNSVQRLRQHRVIHTLETNRFEISESALRGNVKSYTMKHLYSEPTNDIMALFSRYSSEISSLILSGNIYNYF